MVSKTDLRIRFKQERKTIDLELVSDFLTNELKKKDYYKNSKNILIFYPLKYEINVLKLLDDNKNFYLPKVCNDKMLVCPYHKSDSLALSNLKIKEPCTEPINPVELDLVVVPALAVDKFNYRLGYGGGFYDRFLEEYKNLKSVCLIHSKFVVERLPIESFDRKVDFIITM